MHKSSQSLDTVAVLKNIGKAHCNSMGDISEIAYNVSNVKHEPLPVTVQLSSHEARAKQ